LSVILFSCFAMSSVKHCGYAATSMRNGIERFAPRLLCTSRAPGATIVPSGPGTPSQFRVPVATKLRSIGLSVIFCTCFDFLASDPRLAFP
jgi:hypothetical protein